MEPFSKVLIRGLKQRCWSYAQLAQRTDLTPEAIGLYARGQRIPSVDNANQVLSALGVTLVIGADANERR